MLEFSRPPIRPADVAAATRCLAAGRLDPGPAAEKFRLELARLVGVPADWVALTGSCTQALRACWQHLGRPPVVAPALTWPGTYCWADPDRLILLDTCEEGFMIPYEQQDSERPRLLVPVELWGRMYPMARLVGMDLPIEGQWEGMGTGRTEWLHTGPVVVDAAHNLAASHHAHWVREGIVDAVCYSFAPVKQVTTIRGGAVVAKWAADLTPWLHSGTIGRIPCGAGDNARMTEVGAALGLGQLRRHREAQRRRQAILRVYDQLLPMLTPPGSSGHLAVVEFSGFSERVRAITALMKAGILTGLHYHVPTHGVENKRFPTAAGLTDRILTLSCHLDMTPADAGRVARTIIGSRG